MADNPIKFKAVQNPNTKEVEIQIYRQMTDTEWMMVDRLNELSVSELKQLYDYIGSLFTKKNKP